MYSIGMKLGVRELFYTHVGAYYGNGMVFHNHWKNGMEIVSLREFSGGKRVVLLAPGVDDVNAFYTRVQQALSSPGAFNFLTNNCEHATSIVRNGVASSPQLALYGMIGLLAIGAIAISRGVRA